MSGSTIQKDGSRYITEPLLSAYRSAAYFEYFFDPVEKVILDRHEFLLDLNMASLEALLGLLKIKKKISFSPYLNRTGRTE